MRKKRLVFIISGILFLVGFYFVLVKAFPKDASYFPILVVLFMLDIYLWFRIKALIRISGRSLRLVLSVIYWIPLVVLFSTTLLSLFIDLNDPATPFKIYLMGFVFMMYASKFIPAIVFVITGLLRYLLLLIGRVVHPVVERSKRAFRWITIIQYSGLGIGGILLILFTLGMVKWGYDFQIRQYQIDLPELPAPYHGLRIVQISDIHLGSWPSEKKLEEAVVLVNGLQPDFVLFTGDLVNYTTSEAFPYESILQKIKATIGVYAVLGNHDYGDYATWDSPEAKEKNMIDLYACFERLGWSLLRNQHEIIDLNGDSIAIVGVENWSIYDRFEKRGDLAKAMDGLADVPVVLLMSHDPSHWEKEVIPGYPDIDVTFSGHTHGFQFGIETSHFRWSPVQWFYKRWAGLNMYVQPDGKKQYLYINRGMGTIGYPGRVGILPEITLFVLK